MCGKIVGDLEIFFQHRAEEHVTLLLEAFMEKPLVWAHRGASGYAPENTLPAFAMAADMHADGVELDIQLTKDGEIVVCHDERVDRTSNAKGNIRDFTLDELKKLDFSNGKLAYEGVQIPTMREVCDLLKPTGLTINIELKTGEYFYPSIEEKIVKLIHECGMEKKVIYSSFNHYSIRKIQELDPEAETAFLYEDGFIDMPAYGEKYGVKALHPSGYNLQYPAFMEDCRKRGLDVNVWTIDREADIRACIACGVHAIITNLPDKVRKIVEET